MTHARFHNTRRTIFPWRIVHFDVALQTNLLKIFRTESLSSIYFQTVRCSPFRFPAEQPFGVSISRNSSCLSLTPSPGDQILRFFIDRLGMKYNSNLRPFARFRNILNIIIYVYLLTEDLYSREHYASLTFRSRSLRRLIALRNKAHTVKPDAIPAPGIVLSAQVQYPVIPNRRRYANNTPLPPVYHYQLDISMNLQAKARRQKKYRHL